MSQWLIDVLTSESVLVQAALIVLTFLVAVGLALLIVWLMHKWAEYEGNGYFEPPRPMVLEDRISIEAARGRAVPDALFKLYNTPEVFHMRNLCLPSRIHYRIERFLSPKQLVSQEARAKGIPVLIFAEGRFLRAFCEYAYIELPTRREEDVPVYSFFELLGWQDVEVAPSLEELYVLWCQVARHPGVISETEVAEIERICGGSLPRVFLELYSRKDLLCHGVVRRQGKTYSFYLPPEIVSIKRQTWTRCHPRNRLFFAYDDEMGDSVLFIDLPEESRTDLVVYSLEIPVEDERAWRVEATCTLAELMRMWQPKSA